ncbi:MAG: DUF6452 family protein [Flavobacteriaceae bacterium]|nr:DUF6452 family protein [Flavobacteriaceae bacterium]
MKNILFFIIFSSFISCEKDDICIDPTTPKLIVVFYDNVNQLEKKEVPNLKIEIESLGVFVPINVTSNDSIRIPLRIDVDLTKIRLSKQETDQEEIVDVFTLNYLRSEIFVSRSCGFKTTYSEVSDTDLTTNWINSLTINQTIADETAKHISIFH